MAHGILRLQFKSTSIWNNLKKCFIIFSLWLLGQTQISYCLAWREMITESRVGNLKKIQNGRNIKGQWNMRERWLQSFWYHQSVQCNYLTHSSDKQHSVDFPFLHDSPEREDDGVIRPFIMRSLEHDNYHLWEDIPISAYHIICLTPKWWKPKAICAVPNPMTKFSLPQSATPPSPSQPPYLTTRVDDHSRDELIHSVWKTGRTWEIDS